MYWCFRETRYPNFNLNLPDYLTSHPKTQQVILDTHCHEDKSHVLSLFRSKYQSTCTIKHWINRMINVIFSCPDRRWPTLCAWDHTRGEASNCKQYSPRLLLPVCLQRKVWSVSTYVRHYAQFRYNIKLQQKVMFGYVCKVMTECSQDRKIPSHASNFAHYVIKCNVMTQK